MYINNICNNINIYQLYKTMVEQKQKNTKKGVSNLCELRI